MQSLSSGKLLLGFASQIRGCLDHAAPMLDAACRHQQGIPRQSASLDCGIFVIMYAMYLVNHRPMLFSQQMMPLLREKLAHVLLGQRTGDA